MRYNLLIIAKEAAPFAAIVLFCAIKQPANRQLSSANCETYSMKYHIITLGCPKNSVDSEGMGGILAAQGHTAVATSAAADVVIVNTCSFIAAARDETLQVLRDMAASKTHGQQLIAAGCMAESHGALVQAVPGVDAILSTREWMKIGDLVGNTEKKPASASFSEIIPLMAGAAQPSPAATSALEPAPHTTPAADLAVPRRGRATGRAAARPVARDPVRADPGFLDAGRGGGRPRTGGDDCAERRASQRPRAGEPDPGRLDLYGERVCLRRDRCVWGGLRPDV